MITWIFDILLVALGVGMLLMGHCGTTRQLAGVPLMAAAVDAAFAAQLDLAITPVLSALLVALQGIILLSGVLVLYQDRVRVRNRQARRLRRQQVARSQAAFERAASRMRPREREFCA